MKKLITLILIFCAFKVSAQLPYSYTLNYNSVRGANDNLSSFFTVPGKLIVKGNAYVGDSTVNRTLLWYGTSITRPYGHDNTWLVTEGLPYMLSRSLGYQNRNRAVTGFKADDILAVFVAGNVPRSKPNDIIAFEVGINDAYNGTQNMTAYKATLNALVDSAISRGFPAGKILINSVFYWSSGSSARADSIIAANLEVATARGTMYYDGYNTFKQAVIDGTYTLSAGLHPNKAGVAAAAASMYSTVLSPYTVSLYATTLQNAKSQINHGTFTNQGTTTLSGDTTDIFNLRLNQGKALTPDPVGTLYYKNTAGFLEALPQGTAGQALRSGGAGTAPAFSTDLSALSYSFGTASFNQITVNNAATAFTTSGSMPTIYASTNTGNYPLNGSGNLILQARPNNTFGVVAIAGTTPTMVARFDINGAKITGPVSSATGAASGNIANSTVFGRMDFGSINTSLTAQTQTNYASIIATTTQTWTTSNRGNRISIQNTPNNSTTPVERMAIEQDGTVTIAGLTANRVVTTNASKALTSSAVTDTELGYLSGVTSAIQTQLNTKPTISSGIVAPVSTPGKVGDIYVDTSAKKIYFATGTSSSADWTITN